MSQRPRYFPDESDTAALRPFTPGFGRTPPFLAGRRSLIEELCAGLDAGPDDPRSISVLLGARGMGKTVVLNEVEDAAAVERGWVTLAVAGTDGDPLVEIHKAVLRARSALDQQATLPAQSRRSTGMKFGAAAFGAGVELGATWDIDPAAAAPPSSRLGDGLRYDLTDLASSVADRGGRVLVTLDEMHAVPAAHMRRLGSVLQHVVMREGRAVAFVGAALTYVVDTLLSHRSAATFLSRAPRLHVTLLHEDDVELGLSEPVRRHGGTFDRAALGEAAAAVRGHPYLLQLVGAHAWQAAAGAAGAGRRIGLGHVREAVRRARLELDEHLMRPSWNALSETDRRFVLAMAVDDGPSEVARLRQRLGMSSQQANAYRHRLILSGMVRPAGRGRLAFAYPETKNWLASSVAGHEVS
ncbi:ATP-binding protein [Candidatus Poriferisodalis sp.]|uniref:ATP-binding protein n=1 Tax=Candidatus Poriferisodalis sp. TaxID=3101277 RepID=UPI003B0270B8